MRRPYTFPHIGRIGTVTKLRFALDVTKPTMTSATIATSGVSLTLVFSEAVTWNSGTVSLAGTRSSTGTYSSGSGTATLVFTLGTTVLLGDTETISVSAGAVLDSVSNAVAVISGAATTNNSTQVTGPSVRNISVGTISIGSSVVTLPTRVSGDTLVAIIGTVTSPPTANTGWTRRFIQASADVLENLAVYTRQSDGTDNTPLSAIISGGAYAIFAIQNPATGYDVSASANGTSASIDAPTVTTTATNDVLISAYLRQSGTGSITVPGTQTGTTPATDTVPSNILVCGYQTLVAQGATGTRSATNSSSTGWISGAVAVK